MGGRHGVQGGLFILGCSYNVWMPRGSREGELELQEKVQAVSSPRQHNGICRYWLCQEEGPSSITRRDKGEIASGAGRLTDSRRFPCSCLLSPWEMMGGLSQ